MTGACGLSSHIGMTFDIMPREMGDRMVQVLASAIVDVIKASTPVMVGRYAVEVWGKEPFDYVRNYEIIAKNETQAAQEGIARFVDEMQQLASEE